MKKRYGLLMVWFVLVLTVSAVLASPLSYWRTLVSGYLPNSVTLHQLDGRLWDGRVRFSLARFNGPIGLQWRKTSLMSPISIQIDHALFQGWGEAVVSMKRLALWVDAAQIKPELLLPFTRANKVTIKGDPLVIERLFVEFDYNSPLPSTWRGNGHWSAGQVDYPIGRNMHTAALEKLQFEWLTQKGNNSMTLQSALGVLLASVELTPQQEAQIAIMPALLKAVGQPWSGSMEYPVMVIVEPLLKR